MPPSRPTLADALANHALSHRGVVEARSRWTEGPAWCLGAREVMHLHGTGSVDIRLTRPVIRRLRDRLEADPRVDLRAHVGDWVRVRLRRRSDLDLATELADLAIDANRTAGSSGAVRG